MLSHLCLEITLAASANPLPFAPGDPTWLDNPAITQAMLPATIETILMTLITTVLTIIIGVPLGMTVVGTAPGGMFPNRAAYESLSFLVNLGRSFPFVILAIVLAPFVRALTGNTLGWFPATIPLAVAAIPFFARLVETAVLAVDPGKIEAAQMMGARRWQIMWGVQLREALPALVQSVTVLIITVIGYTTISGLLGAGGLGALALNYGYNQWQGDTMIVAVIVFAILVEVVQVSGDMLSRRVDKR